MTPPKKTEEGPDGPTIQPGDELAEALREASEAVGADDPGDPSPSGGAGEGDSEALQQALDELQDRFVRLQAEFDNFRRRSLKERQESSQYGHQNLVKDLLGSVDNLERAIAHSAEDANANMESVQQGVELVQRELLGALGKHGVKVIEPVEEAFDPTFHEAMGQVPNAALEPNSVVQVLQKGYMVNERMLRPARVLVARELTEDEARNPAGSGETEN
ncbi:MAG: nucleotide exchange factor GrpE [Myxococcota bacterium]|jgi:molecular chaperone GrpE|nr:nucleotide exchange factor GrpE [Myxococcota bacterium]